jgi:hypothetical protein
MPRLFYGNFDFEESLAASRRRRSRSIERILAELAPAWVAIAEPGDFVWCPQPIEAAFFEQLAAAGLPWVSGISQIEQIPSDCELVPWGWTPEVLDLGERVGIDVDPPPLEAIRAVNSRQFARDQELARGLELPGSGIATRWSELAAVVNSSLSDVWLIKSEFSQAGRDRFRLERRDTSSIEKLKRWALPRLRAGGTLFVEPWLEACSEAGIQLTIRRDGSVHVEGMVETHYRGGALAAGDFSFSDTETDRWCEAVPIAVDVAQAVADLGYFGPLGIDAMWYRDADDSLKLRAIQDVNARWTMGRLCLGHRRLLRPGDRGRWLFGAAVAENDAAAEVPGRRIIRTSPEQIAGAPVRLRTAVVIDSSS